MYRIVQFFVLALKIDIFIEFLVSVFYFIQFALDAGFQWDTWVMLIVTIFMLPVLYFGRMTVRLTSPDVHSRLYALNHPMPESCRLRQRAMHACCYLSYSSSSSFLNSFWCCDRH